MKRNRKSVTVIHTGSDWLSKGICRPKKNALAHKNGEEPRLNILTHSVAVTGLDLSAQFQECMRR